MSTALLYENLKKATAAIKDQELSDLIASLEPLLGTDDGKPEDQFLVNYATALGVIARSEKLSTVIGQKGNTITRRRTGLGKAFDAVVAQSNALYPVVNDEGDAIINSIFERVIELAK